MKHDAGLSPGEVRAMLAYQWQVLPRPEPNALAKDDQDAARLMSLMLAFEEIYGAGAPGDYTAELAPLAARVDWLLRWVLADRDADPGWRQEQRPIVLTPSTAQWLEPSASAPGEWGVLRLYPEPRLPRSLGLWVEIEAATPGPDGWCIRARWQGQTDETQELLGKFLFRLHRQEVARARQTQ